MNADFLPFLPDLALLALAVLVLAVETLGEDNRLTFHLAWIGLAGVALLLALPLRSGPAALGGYAATPGAALWKQVFTLATLATVLLSRPYFQPGGNLRGTLRKPGAFYGLLIMCAVGMFAL